ncbi:MAG: S-adenosyl-l-methionine hydroxide adenosyltransferase family protein [Gemmatimonadales bacterium]
MSAIVTLLTDFGTSDGYVAEMKGRLLRLTTDITIVDVAHDIAPGDVEAAAYVLGRTWRAFPDATVHVAVVDPGVGTPRRALAAEAGGHRFVAPDNGLLTCVADHAPLTAVVLPVPDSASPTFHGRDVFAPAAAALANGAALATLGAPTDVVNRLPLPMARRSEVGVVGTIVHVDRFGTLITNIPAEMIAATAIVQLAARVVPISSTFGDVAPGEVVAFTGSGGTLEIAVRDGRADEVLGVGRGTDVLLTG